MSEHQSLDDVQHATELQKTLERWLVLRLASQTRLDTLARFEPADDHTHEARAIIAALREHGRPAARFVARQVGSSGSGAVLWWVESQLAENFARDNESAVKFDDIRLILENALLQAP